MNNTKPHCRNCEFANSHVIGRPFIYCYIKNSYRLRCFRCKFHVFRRKGNITNTL